MAPAGEMETVLGFPPNLASERLPGVCTDRVGMPLALLCLERKTSSWGVKRFPKNWVSTISVLTKSNLISLF